MTTATREGPATFRRQWARSTAAIVIGFVSVAVLSLATDQLLHVLQVYPPWGEPMYDARLNLLALFYRIFYTIVGGYLTARLAPQAPMRHVIVVGILGLIAASAGALAAITWPISVPPGTQSRSRSPRSRACGSAGCFTACGTSRGAVPMSEGTVATRQKAVFERTYRAHVQDLWALWTTRDGFESWWGPEDFRVEVSALDAREGGTLVYDMIADAPEAIAAMKQMGRPLSHPSRATFTEFRPHARLAITHVIDFLPGVPPYESTMTVDFFPSGADVRMVITLDPMHDDEFTRMSTMGFTSQLTKLDKRLGVPTE